MASLFEIILDLILQKQVHVIFKQQFESLVKKNVTTTHFFNFKLYLLQTC